MNFLVNLISFRLVRDLRRDVFRKFNTVPLSAIDTNSHGDLISRVINDVDAVGDGLTQLILQLFSGVVTIIGTLGFMIAIDWKIAIAVFLLTPMSLFLAAFIGRLTHRRFTTSGSSRRFHLRNAHSRALTNTTRSCTLSALRRSSRALSPTRARALSTRSSMPQSAFSARSPLYRAV